MPITIDASTPANVSSGSNDPWTSASFTPPSGALLVVAVMADAFNVSSPAISLASTGITFTERIRRDLADSGAEGYAGLWTGVTPDATARTVAGSTNESADSGAVRVWVLNGADTTSPVDATGEGSSTTNNLNAAALSTSTAGAWVFGSATDWQSLGIPTSSDVGNGWDDSDLSGIAVRKSVAQGAPGAVTLNFDAPAGTPQWNWVALAIKPAAGGGAINVDLGRATEADVAQSLSAKHLLALPRAVEADLGQVLSRFKNVPLLRATVTDLARNVTPSKVGSLGRATETDVGRPLSVGTPVLVTLGRATEADAGRALTVRKGVSLGRALETDTGKILGRSRLLTLGRAMETDTSRALSVRHGVVLGRSVETDLALTLTAGNVQVVVLGRATESDTARPLQLLRGVTLARATETEAAQDFIIAHRVPLLRATESDTGRSLTFARGVVLGRASETDSARVLIVAKWTSLAKAIEADTARDLNIPILNWPPVVGFGARVIPIQVSEGGPVLFIVVDPGKHVT